MNKLAALTTFKRVVELQGFAAAARDLELSNAAVSKHIRELEAHLGVALLTRTTRRLSLTEAGERYYERCSRVLGELENVERELGAYQDQPSGRLRVNAPMSFGILHVAPLAAEFCLRFPKINLDLVLDDRVVDLVASGFDVGLRVRQALADSSLVARRVCSIDRVLVAAPAYLAAAGEPQELADLRTHKLLSYSLADQLDCWTFEVDGAPRTLEFEPAVRANSGLALRPLVLAGAGVAYSPMFIVGPDIAAGRLKHILLDHRSPEYALHAVYPASRHLTPKVRVFIDFVVEKLGGAPQWTSAAAFGG